jgi:phosphate/sulfate permease
MMLVIGFLIGVAVVLALASSKNRSGFGWLVFSFFFSPLLAIIILLCLDKVPASR